MSVAFVTTWLHPAGIENSKSCFGSRAVSSLVGLFGPGHGETAGIGPSAGSRDGGRVAG